MPSTEAAATPANSNLITIIMLVVLIGVMYFLMIRPQRKKEREISDMRNKIRVGDEVITIGGLCGKIVKTREDVLTIQVGADKTRFDIMRWGISKVVSESTNKQVKAEKAERSEDENEDEDAQSRTLPKRLKPKSVNTSEKDENTDSKA